MCEQEEAPLKRYHVEDFRPFYIKEGQLWAPAYIKGRWRVLTAEPAIALKGTGIALGVLCDSGRILPFVRNAVKRRTYPIHG